MQELAIDDLHLQGGGAADKSDGAEAEVVGDADLGTAAVGAGGDGDKEDAVPVGVATSPLVFGDAEGAGLGDLLVFAVGEEAADVVEGVGVVGGVEGGGVAGAAVGDAAAEEELVGVGLADHQEGGGSGELAVVLRLVVAGEGEGGQADAVGLVLAGEDFIDGQGELGRDACGGLEVGVGRVGVGECGGVGRAETGALDDLGGGGEAGDGVVDGVGLLVGVAVVEVEGADID